MFSALLCRLPLADSLRRVSYSRRTALLFGGIALVMALETALFAAYAPPRPAHTFKSSALSPEQAFQYIDTRKNVVIVDLRTKKEHSGARLAGAMNIPMHSLLERMNEIPADRPVLLHCLYGFRSLQAYKLLRLHRPDIGEMRYVMGQIITIPTQ